jgi:quercetin dioxygenase-like cupin family protein
MRGRPASLSIARSGSSNETIVDSSAAEAGTERAQSRAVALFEGSRGTVAYYHEGMDVEAAELLLPCSELSETLAFFTDRLGFRLDAIFPADDPVQALLVGHGLRIRLQRGGAGSPGCLRLRCRGLLETSELIAPNGTRIEIVEASSSVELPVGHGHSPPLAVPALAPEFVLARHDTAAWGLGRAGMRYRDLIPGRQGGRFIASHIVIPEGGTVPDYVHHHAVRLQLIYCRRGWVRVVYEDQGPAFVLEAGDCVLQPPGMRHRVLESSPGLEVVELSCPAEHETLVDHALRLPNETIDRERRYGGQRFVRHHAASASWDSTRVPGFEVRELGIATATDNLANVEVLRSSGSADLELAHDGELLFVFLLEGEATLSRFGELDQALVAGDAVTIPRSQPARLRPGTTLELLRASVNGVRA